MLTPEPCVHGKSPLISYWWSGKCCIRCHPAAGYRAGAGVAEGRAAVLRSGPAAEAFIVGAAATGNARLAGELDVLLALGAAHGNHALVAALGRARVKARHLTRRNLHPHEAI